MSQPEPHLGADDRAQDEPGPDTGRRADAVSVREAAERRRRRARVFGEVLPEESGDESPRSWGDSDPGGDEWLRREVPPHHG